MESLKKAIFSRKDMQIVFVFFCVFLLYSILSIGTSFSVTVLVDYVLVTNNTTALLLWAISFLALYFVYHLYTCLFVNYLNFKFEIRITKTLMDKVMNSILGSRYCGFSKFDSSKVFNVLLYDTGTIVGIQVQIMMQMTACVAAVCVAFVVLFLVSAKVAIVSFLGIPLFIVLSLVFKKRLEELQAEERAQMDRLTSVTKNIINNKRSILLLKNDEFFYSKYDKCIQSWIVFRLKYLFYYLFSQESPKLTVSVMKILAIMFTASEVMRGSVSLGNLFLVSAVIAIMFENVEQMMFIILRRNANIASFTRVKDMLFIEDSASFDNYTVSEQNRLEISNVKLIRDSDFSLSIPSLIFPERGICLIEGENGSGKSTLLNLFSDFLEKDCIQVDGHVKTVQDNKMSIAYLSAPHIFIEDTVLNNILLGNKKSEKYEALASMLNISNDFSEKEVSLSPLNLSYGEQQKIALCRILLQEFRILFLDEPFVSLDKETTQSLWEYLRVLAENTLIVIISHDVDVRPYAKKVYKIDNGVLSMTDFEK